MKSALASLAGFYGHIPFTGLVVGHSLFVSALFKRSHDDRFLLNYWISFLAAFGGGTLTALLIQVLHMRFHQPMFSAARIIDVLKFVLAATGSS